MIKFYKKIILSFALFFLVLEIVCNLLLNNFTLSKSLGVKKEFQNILYLANLAKQTNSDTLYIGDSVGRQLYPPGLKSNYVTTNGAVMIDGNIKIIKKALKHRANLNTIYYIATPQSVGLAFDHELTSSNFFKPFVSIYDFESVTPQIISALKTRPASLLYLFNFGKFVPFDDILFSDKRFDDYKISEFSMQGLSRLVKFCNKNNLTLHLISPPLPNMQSEKVRVQNFNNQINNNPELRPLMNRYLNSITFLPRSNYRDDLHFKRSFLKKNRKQLRQRIESNYFAVNFN